MTILTAHQQDALTELVNIGFGRTAAALSELTDSQVLLDVPSISLHPMQELSITLKSLLKDEVATVQQIFNGPVAGNALMLLSQADAITLTNLVSPWTNPPPTQLDSSSCEVLTEVGNILLNACLGIFGNLLRIQVSFSVPRMNVEALEGFLTSLVIDQAELQYALLIYTAFRLKNSSVEGYLIIVLGVSSLENLLQAIEQWANPDTYIR